MFTLSTNVTWDNAGVLYVNQFRKGVILRLLGRAPAIESEQEA